MKKIYKSSQKPGCCITQIECREVKIYQSRAKIETQIVEHSMLAEKVAQLTISLLRTYGHRVFVDERRSSKIPHLHQCTPHY